MAVNRYWGRLYADFADFQIVLCTGQEVVAAGNTIPVFWDGTIAGLPAGLDGAIERGVQDLERGRAPTVASALLAIVPRGSRGRGLGGDIIGAMKTVAAEHGLDALIAPVRPTLKSIYPLTPMESYVAWRREDGLPFDPWLHLHVRLGAEVLRVAPRSMLIEGTISDWERWTGMRFPQSGSYVVPGALSPVVMDIDADVGTYEEQNVWVQHAAAGD